jgi:hypothetical protein
LSFIIAIIVIVVSYLLYSILSNFIEETSSTISNLSHSDIIEIIWTSSFPALVLINLSSPSLSLLYNLDEILNFFCFFCSLFNFKKTINQFATYIKNKKNSKLVFSIFLGFVSFLILFHFKFYKIALMGNKLFINTKQYFYKRNL